MGSLSTTSDTLSPLIPPVLLSHAQPCLTLSQYISDSDLYFKSNTVFQFLPGLHHANQTLDIQSVENVSLEGEHNSDHPIVIMDIHCSSNDCAGFHFHNVTHLTIHSLDFSVYVSALPKGESPSAGFMYTAVNTLHMHHTSIQVESSSLLPLFFGIAVFISEHILLQTLTTNCSNDSRCNVGISIDFSQYTTISRTIVVHAQQCGIFLINSNNITVFNTSVMYTGTKECIGKIQTFMESNVSCFGLLLEDSDRAVLYTIQVNFSYYNMKSLLKIFLLKYFSFLLSAQSSFQYSDNKA